MADHCRLDPHAQAILEEYRAQRPVFEKMQETIPGRVRALLDEAGIVVASVESRIKEENSLAGKLALKGGKYASLADITDIFGMRIITFYTDDVDKVASAVDRLFEVDWENSVDKRKLLEVDSFGYLSLHYICRDPEFPYRFEVQMRTILQHAWANMNHDTGYKSGVEVPVEYHRNMNRLAGMLELVDEQFSRIRTEINDYRRQVQSLVASGRLEEVPLDGDSYRSFLQLRPFDPLNKRIASVTTDDERADVTDELIDRYGDLPQTVSTLLDVSQLRGLCNRMGISQISRGKDGIMMRLDERYIPDAAKFLQAISETDGRLVLSARAPASLMLKDPSLQENEMLPEALKVMRKLYANLEKLNEDGGAA